MKIFNSLTRQLEEFEPRNAPQVGVYTCGPTVYSTPTIGNFRTYATADLVVRTLNFYAYQPKYVMNLTDVGHLTGDNEGDADTGDDRLEKAAKKEGRTAWEIADGYTKEFMTHLKRLNLRQPDVVCKATDHIPEQIELVKQLETNGLTYKIADGIYFDTVKYEQNGSKYGELSTIDEVRAGARVEPNPEKRNPRDFALWKLSPANEKRQMEWDSPWGKGFPGWHIECSAMSMKYLGEQFDLHMGGEDLRSTHHPNEIAQAEGATGKKPFVKYWLHGAFLLVDGGRMGKSLGNAYTVQDIADKGYDPLALRYFYLTGHYRKQQNFTWEALGAAAKALDKLRQFYVTARQARERTTMSPEKLQQVENLGESFREAIGNDFDFPRALAIVWETVKSNIADYDKAELLAEYDQVLGLGLANWQPNTVDIPPAVSVMLEERKKLRNNHQWDKADEIRRELSQLGYEIEDTPNGEKIQKRQK